MAAAGSSRRSRAPRRRALPRDAADALGVGVGADAAAVRAALAAKLKAVHPDVAGPESTARAAALLDAYARAKAALAETTGEPRDVFASPEAAADVAWVDARRCMGAAQCAACWGRDSCVAGAPETFGVCTATGAARARSDPPRSDAAEYAAWMAAGRCPRECIVYVSPRQAAELDALLADSADPAAVDVALAAADWANGRAGFG